MHRTPANYTARYTDAQLEETLKMLDEVDRKYANMPYLQSLLKRYTEDVKLRLTGAWKQSHFNGSKGNTASVNATGSHLEDLEYLQKSCKDYL